VQNFWKKNLNLIVKITHYHLNIKSPMLSFEAYKAEDFLLDDTFLRFCNGTDQFAIDFWSNWLLKHPEKRVEADQAKELYLFLNGNHNAETFQKDKTAITYLLDYLLRSNTLYSKNNHNSIRQAEAEKING
jgi:hypothetical protein